MLRGGRLVGTRPWVVLRAADKGQESLTLDGRSKEVEVKVGLQPQKASLGDVQSQEEG